MRTKYQLDEHSLYTQHNRFKEELAISLDGVRQVRQDKTQRLFDRINYFLLKRKTEPWADLLCLVLMLCNNNNNNNVYYFYSAFYI